MADGPSSLRNHDKPHPDIYMYGSLMIHAHKGSGCISFFIKYLFKTMLIHCFVKVFCNTMFHYIYTTFRLEKKFVSSRIVIQFCLAIQWNLVVWKGRGYVLNEDSLFITESSNGYHRQKKTYYLLKVSAPQRNEFTLPESNIVKLITEWWVLGTRIGD